MLLTRKATGAHNPEVRSRLTRSVSSRLGTTIDRRTFLKRSGLAVGAGAAVSQLPFNIVAETHAAQEPGVKTEVKRTV
ncbi:MAG TPA: twin-arginine translocation signal domain-containing protein, partial [Burkholderiales bacterium]